MTLQHPLYPDHQNVQLYFADWGYSTPQQRERALFNPRVRVIDLADFACMCRTFDPSKCVLNPLLYISSLS